ncbi:MAG: hypothetical protein NTW21_34215 [Verrucomicrobia bacterium]|nr:hypothetical protein [Verrucomicrobiota bacterium]
MPQSISPGRLPGKPAPGPGGRTPPDDMTISIPQSNAVAGKLLGRLHITKP